MTSMIERPPDVTAPVGARPRARWLPASAGQALVWFAVVALVVGPFFPLVYSSLRSKPIYLPGGTFTLGAYRTLFADPLFWRAVRNTVSFALGTTVLAVVGGTALAILCARTNLPGRKAYRLLLIAPIVIPPLGLIVGWLAIYGQGGYITQVVSKNLHLPVWNLSSIPGMSLLGAVITIPIVYLTVQAALAGTDSSLEDAARSAGAGPWRVITRVTLPIPASRASTTTSTARPDPAGRAGGRSRGASCCPSFVPRCWPPSCSCSSRCSVTTTRSCSCRSRAPKCSA